MRWALQASTHLIRPHIQASRSRVINQNVIPPAAPPAASLVARSLTETQPSCSSVSALLLVVVVQLVFLSHIIFANNMRGLLITAAMAPVYAQHNTIESTFNMLSVSVSNSVGYVLNVPINMGTLETFLSGKDVNAPLSSPIIATTSVDMAASGSLTQQTLWGSVLIENVKSFIAFEDTGTCQFYGPSSMAFRSSDPGSSCPATTSTIPSENTGAAHEQARAGNCLTDWHLDGMGVKTTSYRNTDFDPRTRSWYMETKAAKTPTWSSL